MCSRLQTPLHKIITCQLQPAQPRPLPLNLQQARLLVACSIQPVSKTAKIYYEYGLSYFHFTLRVILLGYQKFQNSWHSV